MHGFLRFSRRVLYNTIFWFFALLLFNFFRTFGIGQTELFKQVEEVDYTFMFIISIVIGITAGIGTSVTDVILNNPNLRKYSYGKVILIATSMHVAMLFSLLYAAYQTLMYFDMEFMNREFTFWMVLKAKPAQAFMVYATLVGLFLMFIKQLDYKLGPGNLLRIILGYYHQPREEVRIFMFLDLKSSTTAAEQMGHIKYSEMLQDCFNDLTDPVTKYKAEIYQYVGDEVILHWSTENGTANINCIKAFFEFNNTLLSKKEYYLRQYGWVPTFKAGLHIGRVTVAEVGYVKREIAYHGDVLNTAARIQGICNQHNQNMLISEDLYKHVNPEDHSINVIEVGSEKLKGKTQEVLVYGVTHNG